MGEEKGNSNGAFEPEVDYPQDPPEYSAEPNQTIWTTDVPTISDKPSDTVYKPENKDDATVEEGEEMRHRDTWDRPIEFLLTCISMSVGLGNVWRFPFTAYDNGGGAFLIPYLIILTLIGRPIYYMEMCLGQFSSFGQVKMWNMSPLFRGVGYGSTFGSFCAMSYYVTIMAQCVFFFFASFAKDLPWSVCNKDWDNGAYCHENGSFIENSTDKTVAELYYDLDVFPKKAHIDDGIGSPDWRLSLCLLLSYTLIFLSMWKGVKSSGKVAYFTALFPYVVLLILLIRGVTLSGAWEGIKYFIEPKWDKMLEAKVWYAAVQQCFFSLGTGFGTIAMFSSFNPFKHNIYRDVLILSVTDTLTSILAGITIFAVLGHLAELSGGGIEDVIGGGPGLAFVSYPEAIAKFPFLPQLFAVLFFIMLITLAVGSAGSYAAAAITLLCDQFESWNRSWVTLGVCIAGFFSGLMYVTPGGQFMSDLIDYFGSGFIIFVMAMTEVAAVSWVYGLNNFCRDVEFMLDLKVGWYFKACWGVIIPVGLFGILCYAMATQGELTHGDVPYPSSAVACGWVLAAVGLLFIPGLAWYEIVQRKSETGFVSKVMAALKPTADWGPSNPQIRKEWKEYKSNF